MSQYGRDCCNAAILFVNEGDYRSAIIQLRAALKVTTNRKAWSKLMLAIRELSRVA